jgi:uncharacterized protein
MTPTELMREYIGAARSGDWEKGFSFFADDIVLHIPGRSSLAGAQRGKDVAVRYIETARELSHDADVEVELIDMLVSEERVALIVFERFSRGGEVVEIRRANLYRIAGEKIVEIWIFEHDQYAVDELLAG